MKNLFQLFCFLLLSLTFTGCVGTVEDKAKIDNSKISQSVKLKFDGIAECFALSDRKIEVTFPPATVKAGSLDANTLVYKVYLNGNLDNSVSSKMAADLRSDESGKYHLEIPDLSLNTTYSFIVRAQDPVTGAEDNNTASCSTRTLNQKLPIFDGVVDVDSYPGVQGQNSLLLKWNTAKAAEYLLGGIPVNGYKIAKYNIYYSTTSDNPDSMQLLSSITESNTSPVTQFHASGLVIGQQYFYMIRAVDENNREEKNRIVKSAATATPQNVSFVGIKTLTVPANTSGYTSLRATWPKPNGDFNRYRIFAVPESAPLFGSSSIDPNDSTYRVVDLSDVSKLDSLVVGLTPDKRYEVFVVACMYNGATCVTKAGDTIKLSATTTPVLAPFGGISTVVPMSGALGLNNVTLNWSNPATTAGVCDGINLYEKGNAIKSCGAPDLGAEEACVNSSATCSSTSIDVGNLKTGNEYCFSAKVFEGARVQSDNIVERCFITQFEAPVFQSPPVCTADNSGTKMKIDWQAPNPVGLYTNYLVISKKDDGMTLNPVNWQDTAKGIYEGTMVDLSGQTDRYKFSLRAKSTLSYTVTGLSPDTNYRFMVKTYLTAGGGHYYDNGTTVVSCKTRPLSLQFSGWKHLLAVGPRINGLADHRNSSSTEALAVNVSANPSVDDVNFAPRGIEPETLKVTNGITYPKVIKDGTEAAGNSGLVQLMWSEYKTPDGTTLETYLYNQGISLQSGDGYFIYRKVTPGASNDAEFESTLNQIAGSSSGWALLNPGAPVNLDATTKIGTYTDMLPDGFHPIHSTNGTVAFRDKANTGKVIWYTIRFKLDGKLLGFQANVNKDAIVPIIVPPANMASIHHWMANRKTCELMNKDFDRNNNYRCIYGGLGAKQSGDNYYYDAGGHVLVDRWALGCNFTRYDEAKSCKNSNSSSASLYHQWYPNSGNTPHGTGAGYYGVRYGQYVVDPELKDGDCSGVQAETPNQFYPNAEKGAVYFNARDLGCYYRVQDILTGVPNYDQTNAWKKVGTITDFATSNAEQNRLPAAISNELLNRVYPSNNDPDNLKGVGAVLSSNDSSLPPLTGVTHAQGHYLCQSHAITLQAGSTNSAPFRKRHVSSTEFNTMSLPHPNTTDAQRSAVEYQVNNAPSTSITHNGFPKYTMSRDGSRLGQCSSRDAGGNSAVNYGNAYMTNRLSKIVHTFEGANLPPIWVSGSYDVAGIANRHEGTERCVSGFGVQDHVGNSDFWLSEQMLCQVNGDGSNGECHSKPTDLMIDDYETVNAANRWPRTRYFSIDRSYFGAEDFKNANSNYFGFSLYIDQGYNLSFGVPQESKTRYVWASDPNYQWPGYNSQDKGLHYPYRNFQFNSVLGVSTNCASGLCHADDQLDVSTIPFPANFGLMTDKYFELKYNPTLTAGEYFVKYRRRNQNKTSTNTNVDAGYYYYTQMFRKIDGLDDPVTYNKRTHRYSMDWMIKDNETERNMGVRCAVKVKIGLSGNIETIDDETPN